MSFQTCTSFFLLLNIKEDILKNAGNQTVDGPHCLPQYFFPYLEINGDQQLFFKISSLYSTLEINL